MSRMLCHFLLAEQQCLLLEYTKTNAIIQGHPRMVPVLQPWHIPEARHHTFYSHESGLISQTEHVATFFYQEMPSSKTIESTMVSSYMTYDGIWHLWMNTINPNQALCQHVGSHLSENEHYYTVLKNTFCLSSLFYLFLMLVYTQKPAFENSSRN